MRRVYHFLPARFAIDDLQHSRLKIARIEELNDPFDLWAISQPTKSLRQRVRETKRSMSERFGMLCFSKSWKNPVLWSHYADRHHGMALGFDVDETIVRDVEYVRNRPQFDGTIRSVISTWTLFTKFIDWQYEDEVRIFVQLPERDRSGHCFAEFGEQLVLREVIVGPLCNRSKNDVLNALGSRLDGIRLIKSRTAFRTFNIVADKRGLK